MKGFRLGVLQSLDALRKKIEAGLTRLGACARVLFYSLQAGRDSVMHPVFSAPSGPAQEGLVVADSFRKLRCSPTSFAGLARRLRVPFTSSALSPTKNKHYPVYINFVFFTCHRQKRQFVVNW